MKQSVIEAKQLKKTFHASGGRIVEAVKGVNLQIGKGEIFGLLGPNGAGKTTLLRMLGTIITPTSGHCITAGINAQEFPEQVRQKIGFLSGNTKLYGRLTAYEMLQYFGRLYNMDDQKINQRIDELAELLDMKSFLHRRCDSFSTGQAQKTSIARVILHDPPVLILDEPTLGLDIMTCQTILNFIEQAKERGHSIIFSTHYMSEAELICDRIAFIYAGRILTTGNKEQLYQKTSTTNLKDAFLNMVAKEEEKRQL